MTDDEVQAFARGLDGIEPQYLSAPLAIVLDIGRRLIQAHTLQREALQRVEWVAGGVCVCCGALREQGHAEGCVWQRAMDA